MKNLFYLILIVFLLRGCLNQPTNQNQQTGQTPQTKTLADAENEGLKSGTDCDTLLLDFTFKMNRDSYLRHANTLSKSGKIDLMNDNSFVYYLLTSDYKCYTRVTPDFYDGKLSKLICNIISTKSYKIGNPSTDIASSVKLLFDEKYGNVNGINMFINKTVQV